MPNTARKILLIIYTLLVSMNDKPIMNIEINKIGVKEEIYAKESINNDIDKHVIILKESGFPDDEMPIIIGAHSGTGPLAYFKNLNKLKINDEIVLKYRGTEYRYIINSKYKDDKNGLIKIGSFNDLVLFTCYPNDKNNYLIITSGLQV